MSNTDSCSGALGVLTFALQWAVTPCLNLSMCWKEQGPAPCCQTGTAAWRHPGFPADYALGLHRDCVVVFKRRARVWGMFHGIEP